MGISHRKAWARFIEDNGTARYYRVDVVIMPDTPKLYGLPSLLGQDILSRWRTTHSPAEGQLHAAVLPADLTRP